jgi:acyl dehydratase
VTRTNRVGLFFEDFDPAVTIETGSRTITAADVDAFARLSGDFNPQHTDEDFARSSVFGERIPHGLLGILFTSGLLYEMGVFDRTGLAFLALEWEFLAPARIGDSLSVRQTVLSRREVTSGDKGIIDFGIEVLNQDGVIVQRGMRRVFVQKRSSA